MHPLLENTSVLTLHTVVGTKESAQTFLDEMGLLPEYDRNPPCPKCAGPTHKVGDKDSKLGWRFICNEKHKELKCSGAVSPTKNTFFENSKIALNDVLTIIIFFAMGCRVTWVIETLNNWRAYRKLPSISSETICDYYSYCREIAEVFSSHHSHLLGGPGKTIEVDETFLNKRKYNRGRFTKPMTYTVLGIYCREDKEGLFFLVNGKKKADLWPRIKLHCHPETQFVCTDSAKQYSGIEKMFPSSVHKTTNHSIGEFVSKTDKSNTINPLENQNKHLKNNIVSRSSEKFIRQYMALYYYRRTRLAGKNTGQKIYQFLKDIATVYPGPGKIGLFLKEIDEPTADSMGIADLMPKERPCSVMTRDYHPYDDEEIEFIDNSSDEDWDVAMQDKPKKKGKKKTTGRKKKTKQ